MRLFLLVCLNILILQAHASVELKPQHPDAYTVQAGDTLWSIAGKFLHHPGDWPKVWRENHKIENPDKIYPGDLIRLHENNGKPYIMLDPAHQGGTVKLTPSLRSMVLTEAVRTIPMQGLRPFLNHSKIVDAAEFDHKPYVVAQGGEHIITGKNDDIFIEGLDAPIDTIVRIYRKGKTFAHPTTHEYLGEEAEFVAEARVIEPGFPTKLQVIKAVHGIIVGDKVLPQEDPFIDSYIKPTRPQEINTEHILHVFNGVNQIGQYQVIAITGGKRLSIQEGAILGVFHPPRKVVDRIKSKEFHIKRAYTTLPKEKIGEILVFRHFEKMSLALVLQSVAPINLADIVGSY